MCILGVWFSGVIAAEKRDFRCNVKSTLTHLSDSIKIEPVLFWLIFVSCFYIFFLLKSQLYSQFVAAEFERSSQTQQNFIKWCQLNKNATISTAYGFRRRSLFSNQDGKFEFWWGPNNDALKKVIFSESFNIVLLVNNYAFAGGRTKYTGTTHFIVLAICRLFHFRNHLKSLLQNIIKVYKGGKYVSIHNEISFFAPLIMTDMLFPFLLAFSLLMQKWWIAF